MESYPLEWPVGYERTEDQDRRWWNNYPSLYDAASGLFYQLDVTGATNIILSTNIPTRNDGIPYSRYKNPEDPGAAVYFDLDGQSNVLCCDSYQKVEMNVRAIALSVEQLRQISKRGVSDFLRRAFTGFKALPEHGSVGSNGHQAWWLVLEVSQEASPDIINAAWRAKIKKLHADVGGSDAETLILNEARKQGLEANG